jgi:hypothetical protein
LVQELTDNLYVCDDYLSTTPNKQVVATKLEVPILGDLYIRLYSKMGLSVQ